MGIYLRKSVWVGPFRFNLSKGGVGVSVGVKGLRVGTGPRGNYVHMGRGGIHYRATLPAISGSQSTPRVPMPPPASLDWSDVPSGTHGPMVDIDSALATTIVDSSSAELLDELSDKQRRVRFWPWALTALLTALLILFMRGAPVWAIWVALLVGGIGVAWAYYADLLRKSVVLLYELDKDIEQALEAFHRAADGIAGASRVWHISARAHVHNAKYHAGASGLVKRRKTRVSRAAPPFVKTNVETIAVEVGAQTLHFFPDRVLIYDSSGVGGASFGTLRLEAGPTSFIEDEGVPSDATITGYTWRFVNKRGGPDKRFKNNHQIPICAYDRLGITSATGIDELLHVSKGGAAVAFATQLQALSRVVKS
ncbi:DUF4236 domain-containing protein [Luteimonas sp. FCS-9]|uniref:DUF4236 domain-containing protein n=1 Tax=Luteimonas sp. FCS-9 TaxID=1547516 RepID=UPI00063E9B61|nr:DUF4236 domain-containing protein [Luteimonas sp. FCS-9]